jgi:hypothetical protein
MTATPCAPLPGADDASYRHGRAPGEQWRDSDGLHIEVRDLAPPGPLVAIVRLVESVHDATPVIVHHDRDPQLLYGELADRGWIATPIEGDPGEFRLRLERGR